MRYQKTREIGGVSVAIDPNRRFRDDDRVPCFGGPMDIDEPAAHDFHYIDLDQRQSINLASTFCGTCSRGVYNERASLVTK